MKIKEKLFHLVNLPLLFVFTYMFFTRFSQHNQNASGRFPLSLCFGLEHFRMQQQQQHKVFLASVRVQCSTGWKVWVILI